MVTYLRRNHLALLALFVALGGTSYAAAQLPRNSVGPKQIRPNAVRSADVKNGTLRPQDFGAGTLLRGPKGDTGARGAAGPRGATGTVDTANFFTKAQSDGRFLRLGSGTGTSQGPNFPPGSEGLVIRRIYSGVPNNNHVVARVGAAAFERDDGTAVSFRIDNDGPGQVQMQCYGMAENGTALVKQATVAPNDDQLVLGGPDAAHALTCNFLYLSMSDRHLTQVIMQRVGSSNEYVGTLISSDDQ